MLRPGEIYEAVLNGAGRRRIIVVSREDLNRGRYLLAVPCTTARFAVRQHLPHCVPFRAGQFGFTQDCVAQCELLTPVLIVDIETDSGPLGVLDDITLRQVIKALGHVMDSDCEPN